MSDAASPDPGEVRLERTIEAPRERVFDAWLSAEVLRRWWPAGSDWETPIAEVDARVGGKLRLVMRSPEGEEFGGSGEYVEIERPERLAFVWLWDGHAGHEGRQLIQVDFRDAGEGRTHVLLTNKGLHDEESKRWHREGWEASFDNLERVLRG
jgi:uncharacterized protein YndB with AHSA1/START domain